VTLDRASIIASLRPNTNTEGLSDYELLRLQKIQRNEAKLASLGLCGITSKNHSHNSGSSGIGGNGTNEGSGKINESYKDIVDSEAYLPFSPPPVPRYPSKPRQFLHPTTQTDNRISTLNDNEDVAWEEYQNLKPDLVTPNDNAIATKSNSSSRWREMESDDVDVDSCYICDDGGGMLKLPCFDRLQIVTHHWCAYPTLDLILCDYCPKAFHLNCHIPRLFRIPQGDWRCCECSASMYKKRHRCGECQACLRPDCGVCSACKGKKKFGGDGTHGKACKDRDCKNMRFAPPERMSNNGTCPFNSRKKNVELIGNSRSAFKSVAESSSNRMSNNSLNLLDCPFSTSFEPSPDNGLNSREIEIMRLKPSNKRCFFSEIFPGKTLRVRSKLDDGNPEKTVTFVSRFSNTDFSSVRD
jgi:hypothetical protein